MKFTHKTINKKKLISHTFPLFSISQMEFSFSNDLQALPKYSISVLLLLAYARFSSAHLRPGLNRLVGLLPILSVLPLLPFLFSTIHFRVVSAFFLTWLSLFKLLLLCFDLPPLNSSLPLLRFISLCTLPIKPINNEKGTNPSTNSFNSLFSAAIKLGLLSFILSLYRNKHQLNYYVLFSLYCIHMYLAVDLVLYITAIFSRLLLRTELEPQFNKPYLSTSLRDLWGRRWNLMVSDILRPTVYNPVRARYGTSAGILATFAMSGLMHEIMFYYITFEKATGEVSSFFLLHGVCTALEGWYARHKNWPVPPKPVRTVLTIGFFAGTGYWLFFPPVLRNGSVDVVIEENFALLELMEEVFRKVVSFILPVSV
ncbi:hypothetical protein LUZ60_016135 [Juncus effusus]|nr:hypothetical protein LUZ60_016135 [Juncus effusus]